MSLRERLIALADDRLCNEWNGMARAIALAAARMALEDAARECERMAKRAADPDSVSSDRWSPEWQEAYWQCPGSMMANAKAIRALADALDEDT